MQREAPMKLGMCLGNSDRSSVEINGRIQTQDDMKFPNTMGVCKKYDSVMV